MREGRRLRRLATAHSRRKDQPNGVLGDPPKPTQLPGSGG
jgi:hypothetical protein